MSSSVITIRDAASGSAASILPAVGFNCFSFKPVIDGEPVEVLWAEPGLGPDSPPDLSGIPILFPFGGRMIGGALTFEGERYETPSAMFHGPNAMHGFVLGRAWRVIEQTESCVLGEFHASADAPELLKEWPSDFKISVSYDVAGPDLRSEISISNPGDKRLPVVFATHPYFQLSLGGRKPEESRLTVPAAAYLEPRDGKPSGQRLPVDERNDLRTGPAMAGRKLNDIYVDLQYANDEFACAVLDPISGRTVTQTTPHDFNCCVIYTHAEREAIAIEPYIGMPDAFTLEAEGIATGMKVLGPGEAYETSIVIRLA